MRLNAKAVIGDLPQTEPVEINAIAVAVVSSIVGSLVTYVVLITMGL